jgi:hypothetical protein
MDLDSRRNPSRNCLSSASAQTAQYLASHWQCPADGDPLLWATQYLGVLRDLAPQPRWISLTQVTDPPGEALIWMGQHIYRVNRRLGAILDDLLDCFEAPHRPKVQIFAAPIAPEARVDGFCSDGLPQVGSPAQISPVAMPITLMVDPSRIVPADWPGLVAHELAHGVAGAEGHGAEFGRAIAHLCLAQDLPLPAPGLHREDLKAWPPCRRTPQPEQFWLGQWPPAEWM